MDKLQGEVDDAIAELEGMRRAAEADEAATVQLRKRLVGLQGTLRKSRHAALSLVSALCCCACTHEVQQAAAQSVLPGMLQR